MHLMYIRPLLKEIPVQKLFSFLISFSLGLTAYGIDLNIIEGKVQDSHSGKPVPNANILIKDTEEGTTSDIRGVFLIETGQDYPITVIVNHIGYSSTEKIVYDSRTLQIDLWPETLELAPVAVRSNHSPASRRYRKSYARVVAPSGLTAPVHVNTSSSPIAGAAISLVSEVQARVGVVSSVVVVVVVVPVVTLKSLPHESFA